MALRPDAEAVGGFDVLRAIRAYAVICEGNDWPNFTPKNGSCFFCFRQIFKAHEVRQTIKKELPITRCPYCYKSFVN